MSRQADEKTEIAVKQEVLDIAPTDDSDDDHSDELDESFNVSQSADEDKPQLMFYTEVEREFAQVVRAVHLRVPPLAAIAIRPASLNDLVGRNSTAAARLKMYNRWRTVMPFLGSLAHYLCTGRSFAPGNPWVKNFDHQQQGVVNYFNIPFTPADSVNLVELIRGLLPWTGIQHAQPDKTFKKKMGIVDQVNGRTYLILLEYARTNTTDNIRVVVASYATAAIAVKLEPNYLVEAFEQLNIA